MANTDELGTEADTITPAADPARSVPTTPDELVNFARLTAQGRGKPMLAEQIEVLDEEIAARCDSMRNTLKIYGDGYADVFDLETWGRKIFVFESVLSLLKRLDDDPEAKAYLSKRFRRER
jgi:hypothetical protein